MLSSTYIIAVLITKTDCRTPEPKMPKQMILVLSFRSALASLLMQSPSLQRSRLLQA